MGIGKVLYGMLPLRAKDVDTALSDTSENPVQNKVIKAFLDAIVNGTQTVGLANTLLSNNTFAKDETIESWVLATNNFAIKFIVAPSIPSDAPVEQEGFCVLLAQGSARKKVIFTSYHIGNISYEKQYFNGGVFKNWTKTKCGVADTLDGLTATIAELNYCDGVTSNIQTQLNSKAASSHNHDSVYAKTSHTHDYLPLTGKKTVSDQTIFVGEVIIKANADGVEGGEIVLEKPPSNAEFTTPIRLDVYNNLVRLFATHNSKTKIFNFDFSDDSLGKVLHTGISRPVVISSTAPSDTSSLWAY